MVLIQYRLSSSLHYFNYDSSLLLTIFDLYILLQMLLVYCYILSCIKTNSILEIIKIGHNFQKYVKSPSEVKTFLIPWFLLFLISIKVHNNDFIVNFLKWFFCKTFLKLLSCNCVTMDKSVSWGYRGVTSWLNYLKKSAHILYIVSD